MKRKLVTLLCVLALAVSLLPVVAAAAEPHEGAHKYNKQGETVASTCEKKGYVRWYCEYEGCTAYQDYTLNLAQHDYTEEHHAVGSTCTTQGHDYYRTCNMCGRVSTPTGKIPYLELAPHTEQTMPAQPATCEGTGYGEFTICSECGQTLTTAETIPPLGHDWGEWKVTMQPTCIHAGEKERTCQRADCGKTEKEPVPAKGHDWGEWETTKVGTCTEKGEEKRTCTTCFVFETRETDYVHGKTYVRELEGAKKPTCTEPGEKVVLTWCSLCNQLVKEREIVEVPALGHDVKDWTVTKQPTCVKEGERQGVCQRCGVTVTETVPATGIHELDFDNAFRLNEKKPTCTEEGGYNEMVPCKNCDGVQNNGWKVLEKLPHTQGDWEAVDKKTHHALCTECGTECAVENHKFVSKVIREATAKQKGLRQYSCKDCDYSYTVEFAYDPTLDDVPKTGDSVGIVLLTGLSLCMAAVLPLKKWVL